MPSLPCPDPLPLRLELDPSFEPCETVDGDELYPNGIFEFNITRLSAHIAAKAQFHVELIALDDISYGGTSPGLNELTIAAADLSRPVILAEISRTHRAGSHLCRDPTPSRGAPRRT